MALADQAAVTFTYGTAERRPCRQAFIHRIRGWTAEDSVYLKRNRFIAQEIVRVKPIDDQKVKTLAAVTVTGRTKTAAEKLDERYASGMFSRR